ncbi:MULTISPECIES: phosphonoacetaldehyde dehydrogenase [Sorangium]|uniref:Aldehyde dehydrogenase n=1 Tax=Sorangium cellulosum TaxID=56 RepID=A0A4P2QM92_SORCE|nr:MULTISPECIES: phosphonoacetaldehyde dehydrogenase [Sorangium]AUX31095.1 aldehyde dehydrogenase [Sorangium cellulosum]WCQ90475.1 Phosphonoacetaldehyde dehydrogenase [Sorangium sp. Soce836]
MGSTLSIERPGFHFPCLIGGRPVSRDERILVRYPFTGEVIGSVPRLDEREVTRAIETASSGPPRLSRHERSQILLRAAALIEAQADAVARLITWESGLCLKDTAYEVRRALDVLRFAAYEALRDDGQCLAFDISANGKPRRGYTLREPLRLVTAITPFNHPLNQVAHKVAPSIASGSAMVLKPSEKTPLSAVYLAAVLHESGLPPGMLSVVTGDPAEIGRALVTHPAVELVSFTGGVEIGKRIAGMLGYRRAVLELGGNDPLIVLDDADLDEAARLAVYGCYKNSGQRCTAVKRLIVSERVADEFAARLAAASAELKVGDPRDPATDMGTVISEAAARQLQAAAADTLARGARLLFGNARRGALYGPTVMDRVPRDAPSVQQETFGPHAPILRVRDVDEAIAVANGTSYGLSAGVCTNDMRHVHRLVRELRCGTVNVREVPGYRSELSPFGGIKDSGTGVKEGVVEAMKAMSNVKLYTVPWE